MYMNDKYLNEYLIGFMLSHRYYTNVLIVSNLLPITVSAGFNCQPDATWKQIRVSVVELPHHVGL